MGGQHGKLLENRVMGKGRHFSSAPLCSPSCWRLLRPLKPCLLAGGFEFHISADGCFDLMSADSLVFWSTFCVNSPMWLFRVRGNYIFKDKTWYFHTLDLPHYLACNVRQYLNVKEKLAELFLHPYFQACFSASEVFLFLFSSLV